MIGPQTINVIEMRPLEDGTFFMATAMPDLPGQDGGYVILSHLKLNGFRFEYKKEAPQPWMLKGWDIDSVTAAHPEIKVLDTRIITRWEYDNKKFTYPDRKPKEIEATKPSLPIRNATTGLLSKRDD